MAYIFRGNLKVVLCSLVLLLRLLELLVDLSAYSLIAFA